MWTEPFFWNLSITLLKLLLLGSFLGKCLMPFSLLCVAPTDLVKVFYLVPPAHNLDGIGCWEINLQMIPLQGSDIRLSVAQISFIILKWYRYLGMSNCDRFVTIIGAISECKQAFLINYTQNACKNVWIEGLSSICWPWLQKTLKRIHKFKIYAENKNWTSNNSFFGVHPVHLTVRAIYRKFYVLSDHERAGQSYR